MLFNLKEPCAECPYVGKAPGWIGGHDSAQDFVDYVRQDLPFPCHLTNPGGGVDNPKAQHCAGYAIFMNRMCKLSRRPETAAFQKQLKSCETEVVWPPDALVKLHDDVVERIRK